MKSARIEKRFVEAEQVQ